MRNLFIFFFLLISSYSVFSSGIPEYKAPKEMIVIQTGSYTEHFIEAGHWLIQESFPEVSSMILDHLN